MLKSKTPMTPSQYHSVLQKLDAVLGALAEAEPEWSPQDRVLEHQVRLLRSDVLKAESGHPFIALSQLHRAKGTPASGATRTSEVLRVLIVDDDEELRQLIRLLLESEPGVAIIAEAANGLSAIELAIANHPDLILMDVNMPVLDGLLATRILRSVLPESRIVVISGNREPEVETNSLAAGAIAFLAKPVSRPALIDLIRSLRGPARTGTSTPADA
jgi:CheY-like chemotaxis protein